MEASRFVFPRRRVFSVFSLSVISALTFGCGGSKTASSVFPTNQTGAGACAQQTSTNRFIVQWEDGRFTVENDENAEDFRSGFVQKNLALIKHVDHDVIIHLQNQNSLDASSSNGNESSIDNWGPAMMQAGSLWAQGIKGEGISIGVIDGMVDTTHTQLHGNILVNSAEIPGNNIDDDGNGYVDDVYGVQINIEKNDPTLNRHGSHVAGIIAADPEVGPVQGVAPMAKIIPAQFISNNEGGSIGDAIVALNYTVSRGAKIVNLSWGSDPCIEIPNLEAALQKVSDQNVLVVTASGNGDSRGVGVNMDLYPAYPSAYNIANQLNVAASTRYHYLAGFSNYGAKSVHVAAPGVDVFSTVPNNSYESMSGTSMAAPMVSGAAALIWSAVPQATANQVKQALLKSVDVYSFAPMTISTGGRINVAKAYTQLKKIVGVQ